MKSQLETPLKEFIDQQSKTRKSVINSVRKLAILKGKHKKQVVKVDANLNTKLLQLHTLTLSTTAFSSSSSSLQNPTLTQQQTVKNDRKLSKLAASSIDHDNKLKMKIEKHNDIAWRWIEEMKQCLHVCQSLEEARIDFLRTSVWHLTNVVSTNCIYDDECCERIRGSLEKCSIVEIINLFIKDNATGKKIPGKLNELLPLNQFH